MGLTVTEDTPADMLAGNMELLVQLPPRNDDDYDNDDVYDGDEDDRRHQNLRNNNRHHSHHHTNGHHPRRSSNGNARKVIVARSTPMMDLLVQVATSQKLSASSYTLEAIGEHGLVLTHHPNTPIGALDALQVKLLPKQGTFAPTKTRHVNQPFETTFRLQVHLPRNQLYVSRVSSRMNLGKILDEVCREKNLDRNNYELRHPANIEEVLDLSLSLQDYHLQEVTLCPKSRTLGSSLSSQDIMALQRLEERRRQEAKQSVFGFGFKKSKESSLSTDSLGERSVSPARSDGTGRSASPQQTQTAPPTRPQRKRRPAPKPPLPRIETESNVKINQVKEVEKEETERTNVISHSRNSSDSSGYHEASVLSDNLDSNIRVPETLPRRSKLQQPLNESPGRILAETSQASKSLSNLTTVHTTRTTISRGASNSSLISTGLRKKKAAPAPPQPRPLSSAISTQALERIVDSEESLASGVVECFESVDASSDVAAESKPRLDLKNDDDTTEMNFNMEKEVQETKDNIERNQSTTDDSSLKIVYPIEPSSSNPKAVENSEIATSNPNVEIASERKRAGVAAPLPRSRGSIAKLENAASSKFPQSQLLQRTAKSRRHAPAPLPRDFLQSMSNLVNSKTTSRLSEEKEEVERNGKDEDDRGCMELNKINFASPHPPPRRKNKNVNNLIENDGGTPIRKDNKIPNKPRRKTLDNLNLDAERPEDIKEANVEREIVKEKEVNINVGEKFFTWDNKKVEETIFVRDEKLGQEIEGGSLIVEQLSTDLNIEKNLPFEEGDKKKLETRFFINNPSVEINLEIPRIKKNISNVLNSKEINDIGRSCAVISTIPKCDIFQSPKVEKLSEKITGNESLDYNATTKVDSSLASSFGTGKSILDCNYEKGNRDEINGTPERMTDGNCVENELELECLEMFERRKNSRKCAKVLRSHSELNDFEINTFEGSGRYLTSRSMDFTFALNPNLSRNITDLSNRSEIDKYIKRHRSLDDTSELDKNSHHHFISTGTELPAFLTTNITWEKQEYLQGFEDGVKGTAWTLRESGSDNSDPASITSTEATSELLKKVSDTLSGSLRSPTVTEISSLTNEQPSNTRCLDQTITKEGEDRRGVNEAQPFLEVIENLKNTGDDLSRQINDSNFVNDHQSATIDWEYRLPEPPTAFRDNKEISGVIESHDTITAKHDLVVKRSNKTETGSNSEILKTNRIELTLATPSIDDSSNGNSRSDERKSESRRGRNSSEIGDELVLSKTQKSIKKEEEEFLIENARQSRPSIKSGVESGSRKSSYASSTASIAPVDKPLSNFVITTYSRPKNVDIFDEIERKDREPRLPSSRKNSGSINAGLALTVNDITPTKGSRKSSAASINNDAQPRIDEKSKVDFCSEKLIQPEISRKESDPQPRVYSDSLSRSNMKISIATKPRPRGDTISENQRPKIAGVRDDDSNSNEEKITEESLVGNNERFSLWRDNILKKHETPTKERQLQSLQVLRSILPKSENNGKHSDDISEREETSSAQASAAQSVDDSIGEKKIQTISVQTSSNEPAEKRYTYAGPPAIDLGSWSDRSRTRVQIKPDTDYKFEKNRTPESLKQNHRAFMEPTVLKNSHVIPKESTTDKRDRKEPNESTKNFIARTTAVGFKKPFYTMANETSAGTLPRSKKEEKLSLPLTTGEKEIQNKSNGEIKVKEEEIDTRPINFKELKEAFAKEQNSNLQIKPNYGTSNRRTESFTNRFTGRRDTNVNSEKIPPPDGINNLRKENFTINSQRIENPVISTLEKRNFIQTSNRGGYQAENLTPAGRTNRGTFTPVVKGFKIAFTENDKTPSFQEKNSNQRVAIGDISNGIHVSNHNNGNRKTVVQIKEQDLTSNVPKPPPTMPIITGVTLKSTNGKARPKSMVVELDPRNELLESIRGFGGHKQLRKVPRRNTNVSEGLGSRYVRS